MADIVVAAENRTETGKNVNRRLRTRGLIPGVLYGSKKEAVPLAVSPKEITTILRSKTGENTLFDLEIGGSRRKVILKEFQVEPIKGQLLHADFYEVALDKPIEVKVHIEVTGIPVGVKVEGGLLDHVTREVEVSCLPADIPEKITIDVSELEMGKAVRVSDLKVPDKVTMLSEPDLVIVHVVAPRAEEEVAAAVAPVEGEAVAGAEPEVIKKGKPVEEGEVKAAAAPERRRTPRRRTRRPTRRRRSNRCPCAWWRGWATPARSTAARATTWGSWWSTSWPPAAMRGRPATRATRGWRRPTSRARPRCWSSRRRS